MKRHQIGNQSSSLKNYSNNISIVLISLRAKYGTNEIQNAVHGSKTIDFASIEIEYMFPLTHPKQAATPAPAGITNSSQSKADVNTDSPSKVDVNAVSQSKANLTSISKQNINQSKPDINGKVEKAASVGNVTASEGVEKTYAMIKPDAVAANKQDEIIALTEQQGFKVLDKKTFTFTPELAAEFYSEHKGKDFFDGLIGFMTSGPSVGLVLEKANAIKGWREFIGPTKVEAAKESAPQRYVYCNIFDLKFYY